MSKVESSSFNSESSYYSPKSSMGTIQVALVAITLVGGVTATFALMGYLPSVAVWPGAIGGGGAFIAFVVITVKRCCKDDYDYMEGDVEEPSPEESASKSEVIREVLPEDKFYLNADADDDYDFSESESPESSRSLESEPADQEQLCDPFTYHHFGLELAIEVLSHLDFKSLLSASEVNRHWRQIANDNAVWKFVPYYYAREVPQPKGGIRKNLLKSFKLQWEQKQRSIEEQGIFNCALEEVKNPSIKRLEIATAPGYTFVTDSFLVLRTEKHESTLYDLSFEHPKPLIFNTRFRKFAGLSDRVIELSGIKKCRNDHYEVARVRNLNNTKFAEHKAVRRPGYPASFSLHDGNYIYHIWTSEEATQRIIQRWDALTGKTIEIVIPCRNSSISGKSIDILTADSWKNYLICAYNDGTREFWDLNTVVKEEASFSYDSLPPKVYCKLGIITSIKGYNIFKNFEIITGRCFLRKRSDPNAHFICIRNLETKEFLFYKTFYQYRQNHIFSEISEDKVIFITPRRHVLQYDLIEKKELPLVDLDKDSQFFLHGDKLIEGTVIGFLNIWDLNKRKYLYSHRVFEFRIDKIDASGSKIAVTSREQVAILDFSLPDDVTLVSYH